MIGKLPKSLKVNNVDYPIRSDFRIALLIFQALNDPDLSDRAKAYILLDALYENIEEIDDKQEALKQAVWYLDGGKEYKTSNKSKLIDWEQDEQMIFSGVNNVAKQEVREKEYLHWWTFLGYFSEIHEGLLSSVIGIRQKKSKGKKLEKHEQEFYNQNRDIIDLKKRYSEKELAEIERLNKLLEMEVK